MRLSLRSQWICLLALLVAGCGSSTSEPEISPASFGRFEGDVVAVWGDDGRNMTLREDFTYIDSQQRPWLAPAGSAVDGASIPRLFWTVIGGPFEGKYRNASVVHDVGCVEMRHSWEDVHRMFYEACRCGGVDEKQAKIMYYAVYHFGPRWQRVVENVIEHVTDATGQVVEQETPVERIVRMDPPPPTPDELEQVQAYIAEDDPEPAAIERFSRASLHRRPGRGQRDTAPSAKADPSRADSPRDAAGRTSRPESAPSGNRKKGDPGGSHQERRIPGARAESQGPQVSQEEQQRTTEIVRRHLEQESGKSHLAEYHVERDRNGYRVLVQFLHENEEGQIAPYAGGTCTARVSRDGRVLEVVNGMDGAR